MPTSLYSDNDSTARRRIEEPHRQFAKEIAEQIREGVAPWQKPWKSDNLFKSIHLPIHSNQENERHLRRTVKGKSHGPIHG